MNAKKSKKAPSFEEALSNLEKIVTALENGDIPLSDLVEQYKEGLYYQKVCQEYLNQAELLLDELDEKNESQTLTISKELN